MGVNTITITEIGVNTITIAEIGANTATITEMKSCKQGWSYNIVPVIRKVRVIQPNSFCSNHIGRLARNSTQ